MSSKRFHIGSDEQRSVHFRFRYKLVGAHVHVGLWVASASVRHFDASQLVDLTHSKSGQLVFTIQEWEAFRDRMESYDKGPTQPFPPGTMVEFVEDI